ncbi:MAG: 6-carboxytetrahydropterin synthase [Aeromonadaceae bacterium]
MKLFVRDLTVIDASYLCFQRGMVGESWLVDIELSGELNEMSMLLDFARVKKSIKAIIDSEVDHRLLIPLLSAQSRVTESVSGYHYVDFLRVDRSIHLHAPSEAFCFIPAEAVTRESVTEYLHGIIRDRLPQNIAGLSITLRPESIPTPFYHYSHGLKKHDGNCQRIAHGHRSMIELWIDGERDHEWEQRWADRWADIYLGSQEDRVDISLLKLSSLAKEHLGEEHYGFTYQAPQGRFDLAMPKAECELIDTDTTVELLADYIARSLKDELPGRSLRVVAYEGVGKGAIAER